MKKNSGFTLIELLAVIIILAVIALIATPVVLNVVNKAKVSAIVNSAYGVADTAKLKYIESLLDDTPTTNGSVTTLPVSGEKPNAGNWKIDTTTTGTGAKVSIEGV
ncbi:MAG: prepilin-type N-terminal cleavage/methylation domain-containing protein, partial [Bacilli bacterium]